MKIKLADKMKYSLTKSKYKISKHSPEILLGVGIVGVVASAIIACIATTKASEVIEEANEELSEIKSCDENSILLEKYSSEDRRKALTVIYAKTGAKLAKLYFPAVAICGASIFSIVSSNNVLKKRNAELAAAYSAVSFALNEYRKRVVEKLGEEADDELYYGIKEKEVVNYEIDAETGKKKEIKDRLSVVEDNVISPYALYFERPNPFAEDSIHGNEMLLKQMQWTANEMLKARSSDGIPLFLNDVLHLIGEKPTKIGQRVGWRYVPDDISRDNEVRFRIKKVQKPVKTLDGGILYRDTILLDFNVDGDVWSEWEN